MPLGAPRGTHPNRHFDNQFWEFSTREMPQQTSHRSAVSRTPPSTRPSDHPISGEVLLPETIDGHRIMPVNRTQWLVLKLRAWDGPNVA